MEYEGTVLLVSHDREFLNNIVTSTIVFEGEGRLLEYVGGYDDWLRQRRPAAVESKKAPKQQKQRPQRERPRTLTFKEQRELEALPARIEALEAERDSLYDALGDPDLYKREGRRIPELNTRIGELEAAIADAYERWQVLDAICRAQP